MRKKPYSTWGDVFYKCLRAGYDHGWAAYRADLWERRKEHKKPDQEGREDERIRGRQG